MKEKIIALIKFLLFAGIGVAILYVLFQNQQAAYAANCKLEGVPDEDCSLIQKLFDDFRATKVFWILLVLLAFMISNVSRALRWQLLLSPLGYKVKFINAFFTIVLGYFANLGFPRMGEVLRAGTLAKYEKIPVNKVIGTIVTDRIFDVLCLLAVIGIAFLLEFDLLWGYLSEHANFSKGGSLVKGLVVLSILGIIALVALFIFRKKLMQFGIYRKVESLLFGFYEGVVSVRKMEHPFLFLIYTVCIWLMYYLMTYLCFFAFIPTEHLGPLAGLMVFVFGSLGIVIPSPGGMGTYHALVIAALSLYQIKGDDAFSFANIIFFSISIFCNVLFGLLALILLPIYNRRSV